MLAFLAAAPAPGMCSTHLEGAGTMPTTRSDNVTVTMTMSAHQVHATIVLAGDVDMMAEPELADTLRLLAAGAPATVTVDLGAVTFTDSVLPNYLVSVRQAVPETAVLVVSRPTRMARFILDTTDMAQIATIEPAVLETEAF